jgi:hypothetical protein
VIGVEILHNVNGVEILAEKVEGWKRISESEA